MGWQQRPKAFIAVVVTLAFAVLARLLRGVSATGAIAGSLICLLIFVSTGPAGFSMLASVFILAWVSTRVGYLRKQRMGTAEKRDGRKASQVLANLGYRRCMRVAIWVSGHVACLVASAAALAEPAADTVASEVGQARSEVARLITTGARVPPARTAELRSRLICGCRGRSSGSIGQCCYGSRSSRGDLDRCNRRDTGNGCRQLSGSTVRGTQLE